MKSAPWYTYPFLLFPERILRNLESRVQANLTENPPNAWQLSLGVIRMWHRNIFRSETVGTSPEGTLRSTWRAKLLYYKAIRFPFLVAESAIVPLDLTGLASSPEQIIQHLLAAHHDGNQFVFDLELLSAHKGALENLALRAAAIASGDAPKSEWFQDLCVFEGYHQQLQAAAEEAQNGISMSNADKEDADISLAGYLAWCSKQPDTPSATLRAIANGTFSLPKPGASRRSEPARGSSL